LGATASAGRLHSPQRSWNKIRYLIVTLVAAMPALSQTAALTPACKSVAYLAARLAC
jgi:hypothetical protein